MPEEVVELSGHLIESLILPRVLDIILAHKGRYTIRDISVGVRAEDVSFARILVEHEEGRILETIIGLIERHGAETVERREVQLVAAPRDGVLPEDFYCTTNLATSVFLRGRWIAVRNPEMDSAIVIDSSQRRAATVKMAGVSKGDLVVVGRQGVRVVQIGTGRTPGGFGFMSSEVSSEKPKGVLIRAAADYLKKERRDGRPVLWVCGPALVHTGAGPLFEKLVTEGYVQILFAGNALATHDIENAIMGTSLGVSMRQGSVVSAGHENHLRAINIIRRAGGIRRAVGKKILDAGIMHACMKHGVDVVLTGSIRDDGPLPEVINDMAKAQSAMRRRCRRTQLVVMMATLLHSIATGNMLPGHTRVICVDIHESAVTKLMDRGTSQTMGIVTDVQPFLRELLLELGISGT